MAMNNSTSTPIVQCQLYIQHIVLLTFYTFFTIVGIFGNVSIIYVFHYRIRRSKNVTECLITYLAMFDLLSSIFGPFTFVYWILTCNQQWHFGYLGCKILPTLSRIFINISVGIIILLAFDRHRLICTPFKDQLKVRHGHIGVAVSIILSVIVEIHYILSLRIHNGGCFNMPSDKALYRIVSSSLLIIRDGFLVLVFTVTTARTIYTLRKRDTIIPTISNIKANEMKRVVKMIVVMQTVFLVLILPRDLFLISFSFSWLDGNGIKYTQIVVHINEILKLLQTANCCANIFIYSKLHDHFRKVVIPGPKKSIALFLSEMNARSKKRHRSKASIELLGKADLASTDDILVKDELINDEPIKDQQPVPNACQLLPNGHQPLSNGHQLLSNGHQPVPNGNQYVNYRHRQPIDGQQLTDAQRRYTRRILSIIYTLDESNV